MSDGDRTELMRARLRLLHYPEVDADVFQTNKNQVRAGAHTDYGSYYMLVEV